MDLHMGYFGTDDHMYLGVVGTGGGREFALAAASFDDFASAAATRYVFGEVGDQETEPGLEVVKPRSSSGGGANDPRAYRVNLEAVTQVYIRKAGTRKGSGDDAAQVYLVHA